MARTTGILTRRTFAQGIVAAAAMPLSGELARAASSASGRPRAGFAVIGSFSDQSDGKLQVFEIAEGGWTLRESQACVSPGHLEWHPTLPVLYVVHKVSQWANLPRGAVSSYRFDAGRLTWQSTQPLSLSAILPGHAAVSPDGASLLVASPAGGAFNVLPIELDGLLQPVQHIRKELGLLEGDVVKAASPNHVVWAREGSFLLTADSGNERVSVFALRDDGLHAVERRRIHAGAGVSQIAVSRDRVFAMNAQDGSISVHDLDQRSGAISASLQQVSYGHAGPATLASDPAGRSIVAAGAQALTVWSIDPSSGRLRRTHSLELRERPGSLSFTPDGQGLVGISAASGEVLTWSFDSLSGRTGRERTMAQVRGASCISLV